MLNIIHVIPKLSKGGAERLVIDIVRALNRNQDNKVKLILFENNIEYEVDDNAKPSSFLSPNRQNASAINFLLLAQCDS